MKAFLKNYRQSPRKVRLVADLIRGKEVGQVRTILSFMEQKSAPDLKKLIESAVANARQAGVSDTDNLIIKTIMVDEGFVMKRYQPRFGGRATPIRKPTSRVTLELGEKPAAKAKKGQKQEEATPKTAKKVATKTVAKKKAPTKQAKKETTEPVTA